MKFSLKAFSPSELLRMPYKTLSPSMKFLVRQIKIFHLAFKDFREGNVQLRASALTYYSVLSIVPLIALIFGIAKGFGFETYLEEELLTRFAGQEQVIEWILTFKDRYLTHIRGGLIAGIGIAVLLWSVMKLLGNIENSFNDIWQIKKARVISRKLSDYISLVVITPILLFISSSVNIFLADQIKLNSGLPLMGYVSPVLSVLVNLIPYALIWLVFTLLYIVMPNTKVNFRSALTGGIIGGTMFQLLQWGYIYFQGMITSYGAIYGSFAALPLFLIWMQTSWLIVLLGAEIAFANQNVEHYESESESLNISYHMKRAVTLMILKEIVMNFKEGLPSETAEQLSHKLDLPVRLVREIIYELLETNIISETVTKNVKENAYQPGQDIEHLTVGYVMELLDKRGKDELKLAHIKSLDKMTKVIDGFSNELKNSKNNKLVHDLG